MNPLSQRSCLGSNVVLSTRGISPMKLSIVDPMQRQIISPLIRKMGESTLQQRARKRVYGSTNIFGGTEVEEFAANLGDPEIIDVGAYLQDWARVGWFWDRAANRIEAYLTTREGQTFVVRLPWSQVMKILSRCARRCGAPPPEPSLNGFLKSVSKQIKSATKAPARAVKNPRKFVQQSARDLKAVVREVGLRAVNVASHPAFAAVMTGIAVTPPLQAVGGAGLAAYAAARAAKPALEAAEQALTAVERGAAPPAKKTSSGKTINVKKAQQVASNLKKQLPTLPGPMASMLSASLRSAASPPPKFALSRKGVLSRRR